MFDLVCKTIWKTPPLACKTMTLLDMAYISLSIEEEFALEDLCLASFTLYKS
jgi:hypothetical protein